MNKGIFNIYKPNGPTSHDMVDKVRKLSGERRIGHAGTLDPLASGVLVVAVGREFTKQINTIVKKEKEYVSEFTFGMTSTTDDEEGEKTEISTSPVILTDIKKALKKFEGEVLQTPPDFSAVKISGKTAYQLSRQGKSVELQPKKVLIKKNEIISYNWPILKLKITTGPGVYIRAIARDLGNELKCGAYMSELTRTRVGDYRISDSIKIATPVSSR
ncbi:MAG: tRNA pseudouridine(55) synthase TruB [Candidatus Berkelbacteria bacterium]|nr:tRNA pseudouridine(55) synthase TruB [Candidatus Berkelbacteria bacterium]